MLQSSVTIQPLRSDNTVAQLSARLECRAGHIAAIGEQATDDGVVILVSDDGLLEVPPGGDEEMDIEYLSMSLGAMMEVAEDVAHAMAGAATVLSDAQLPDLAFVWFVNTYRRMVQTVLDNIETEDELLQGGLVVMVSLRRVEEHGTWLTGMRAVGSLCAPVGVRALFHDTKRPEFEPIEEPDTVANAVQKFIPFTMRDSHNGINLREAAFEMSGIVQNNLTESSFWETELHGDSPIHRQLSSEMLNGRHVICTESQLSPFFQVMSTALAIRLAIVRYHAQHSVEPIDFEAERSGFDIKVESKGNPAIVLPGNYLQILFSERGIDRPDANLSNMKVFFKCVPVTESSLTAYSVTAEFTIEELELKFTAQGIIHATITPGSQAA